MNKKFLKWTLLVFSMIFIFYMSSKPAVESNVTSEWVIKVLKIVKLDLDTWFGSIANFIVRKTAHFSEYFILSIISYLTLREDKNRKKSAIYAIIICFLYACSDEIHQYFVPGRAMLFMDVLIDTSGGICAMASIKIINIFNLYKKE